MSEKSARRTPLYDLHVELGGKIVDFSGWKMPIHYPMGIIGEHRQCRERAALFDISHMGQVELRGPDIAQKFETLVPSNIVSLEKGKARYTFFTNENGGIMDDLIVSNMGDHLWVVINASMRHQDIPYMRNNLDDIEVIERSDHALVALQGPRAEDVIGEFCPAACELKFMETVMAEINGVSCLISRLGYTGEDGYEISIPQDKALELSRIFLTHEDCEPAGLGSRDSLRLEAGLCLYGQDIDLHSSPIEASLLWAIQKRRREEGGFPGAERIQREIAEGPEKKLLGIKPEGRALARRGIEIHSLEGNPIGIITSGGFGPTLGGPIAMGYVCAGYTTHGQKVNLIIRGNIQAAEIVSLPFVQQNYKR